MHVKFESLVSKSLTTLEVMAYYLVVHTDPGWWRVGSRALGRCKMHRKEGHRKRRRRQRGRSEGKQQRRRRRRSGRRRRRKRRRRTRRRRSRRRRGI